MEPSFWIWKSAIWCNSASFECKPSRRMRFPVWCDNTSQWLKLGNANDHRGADRDKSIMFLWRLFWRNPSMLNKREIFLCFVLSQPIEGGLTEGGQSVLNFRPCNPLWLQCNVSLGKLFLEAILEQLLWISRRSEQHMNMHFSPFANYYFYLC